MSDGIGYHPHIVGLMSTIELSFPFSYSMPDVELKSFYEALSYVYECLNITYFYILL